MLHCSKRQPRPGWPGATMESEMINKAKTGAAGKDAFKQVETAMNAGKETMETAVKAGAEAAKKGYEQAVQMTKEQVEKASQTFFKGYGEWTSLSKENLDAWVASGTILVKGVENLGKQWVSMTQASVEEGVSTVQAMMAAKTLKEVVDMQNEFAKKSLDKFVAEGSKFSELGVKVANEAIEPIQSRMQVTVERLIKQVAA
jgi:phasin family protein